MKLTICTVVENYESYNNSILSKYFDISSQIIVITQNTFLKSSKYIEIYNERFNNDFSELRNLALTKVKNDWVLFLDSDEELSIQLKNKLPELILNNDVDGYWIPRRNYISDKIYFKHGLFYPDYQLRLFRIRHNYFFKGKVHELIQIPKNKTLKIHFDIYHFPRNPKYSKFSDFKNLMPYIKIETKELLGDQKSSGWYIFTSIYKPIHIFLSGFFRGKGFLDGWAGFRAHIIFSFYIFYLNFSVGISKLLKRNILE